MNATVETWGQTERRQGQRRASSGRRADDLGHDELCAIHAEAMRRLDDRCLDRKMANDADRAAQEKVNTKLFDKVDQINAKLNYVLGAAFIVWPILQWVFQRVGK